MADISSVSNVSIKNWKKLHTRKERKKTKQFIIEGFHLVEEALNYKKEEILTIILREDLVHTKEVERLGIHAYEVVTVTENVARALSDTETNQGVFAILKITASSKPASIEAPFLLIDAVQDPGNVGTMIRSADAAGFQGVILGKGTVDLYNSKTLRSAQGSHFHLEVYEGDLEDFIATFKEKEVPVWGTALDEQADSYKKIEVNTPFALIVGNEGAGINEDILALTDRNIYIPMKGQAESLNVAIAASILMFHLYN